MELKSVDKAMALGYAIVESNHERYKKKRYLFHSIKSTLKDKQTITVLSGLRGVGKTVLMSQLVANKDYVYLSMDYSPLSTFSLSEILDYVVAVKNPEVIVLDEFQHYLDFPSLKIFKEINKDIKIMVSGSSALALSNSLLDRRCRTFVLEPLSFREYLLFTLDKKLEALTLKDLVRGEWKKHLRYEAYFDSYMEKALPFLIEGGNPHALIESTLRKDLPVFRKINEENITEIERFLHYLARSKDSLSFTSMSQTLRISKSQLIRYVDLLKDALILNEVMPLKRHYVKERKLYFTPPIRNVLNALSGAYSNKGILYEEFFVQHTKHLGISYIPGKGMPDFVVRGKKFEIGGKSKTWKQKPDYLVVYGRVPKKKELPLISFGFLY